MKRTLVALIAIAAIGFGLIPPAEQSRADVGYYAVVEFAPDLRSVPADYDSTVFSLYFDVNSDGGFNKPVYSMDFNLQADIVSDSGVVTLDEVIWQESNFPDGGSKWTFTDPTTGCGSSSIGFFNAYTSGQSGDPWETAASLTYVASIDVNLSGFAEGDSVIFHFWDTSSCIFSQLKRVESTSPLITHYDGVDGEGDPHDYEYSGDVDGATAYCPGDAGQIHCMWPCFVLTFTQPTGGGGGQQQKASATIVDWSEVKDKYTPKRELRQ